jgi:hypothetical protein
MKRIGPVILLLLEIPQALDAAELVMLELQTCIGCACRHEEIGWIRGSPSDAFFCGPSNDLVKLL